MGIIKNEDIIAWRTEGPNSQILCDDCFVANNYDQPLTDEDFDKSDIVICDECGLRLF